MASRGREDRQTDRRDPGRFAKRVELQTKVLAALDSLKVSDNG